MTRRQLAALVATAVTSFTIAVVAGTPTMQLGGAAAEPSVLRVDLKDLDTVVTGAVDLDGIAWVIARHSEGDALRLYQISADGSMRRTSLPLSGAGSLAGIGIGEAGTIWVAAGSTVARIDTQTGRFTRVVRLDAPASAVATARRAPDGTVLGLGQVTAVAVDQTGAAWVARYAVPSLTRIDGQTFALSEIQLAEDTDADRLTKASNRIWFTTNFGPSSQLGARVGELDPLTRTVRLLPVTAAAVVATADGIEAIGAGRWHIDPVTHRISNGRLPAETLSLGAVAADDHGHLIARMAKMNRLLVFDERGRTVRTIDFDAGTFSVRGRTVSTVAPLSFVSAGAGGAIWFAPRGGNSVYRAR